MVRALFLILHRLCQIFGDIKSQKLTELGKALMCVIFAANSVTIYMLVFSHNLLQVAAVLAFDGLSMGILDAGQGLKLSFVSKF